MAKSKHERIRVSGVRAVGLASIAIAVLALAGCEGKRIQSGTAQGEPVIGPFRGKEENPLRHRNEDQANQKEMVQLVIWRVTIPNQDQKQAEELWKLFKPTRLLTNNAELLGRNGLMVRLGNKQSWTEAISKLEIALDIPGPRVNKVKQIKIWLVDGYGAEVALSTSPSTTTLFWHEAGGDLVGKTYEDCQRLLAITATAQPGSQVQIKLTPALKDESARVKSFRRLALRAGMDPEKYVAKFEQLAVELIVNSDEFLIIGSAAEADTASFGRAFFDDTDPQQPSRTVLLMVPRVKSTGQVK